MTFVSLISVHTSMHKLTRRSIIVSSWIGFNILMKGKYIMLRTITYIMHKFVKFKHMKTVHFGCFIMRGNFYWLGWYNLSRKLPFLFSCRIAYGMKFSIIYTNILMTASWHQFTILIYIWFLVRIEDLYLFCFIQNIWILHVNVNSICY